MLTAVTLLAVAATGAAHMLPPTLNWMATMCCAGGAGVGVLFGQNFLRGILIGVAIGAIPVMGAIISETVLGVLTSFY
jgi:hypothetical protein